MKTSNRDFIIVAVIAAVIIAAGIWYFSPLNSEPNNWPKESFSQEQWGSTVAAERYKLVRDLFERGLLKGKSTSEVEALLGKPTYADPSNGYWLYAVKERQPNDPGFDAVKMVHVDFDNTKRVIKFWIRGD